MTSENTIHSCPTCGARAGAVGVPCPGCGRAVPATGLTAPHDVARLVRLGSCVTLLSLVQAALAPVVTGIHLLWALWFLQVPMSVVLLVLALVVRQHRVDAARIVAAVVALIGATATGGALLLLSPLWAFALIGADGGMPYALVAQVLAGLTTAIMLAFAGVRALSPRAARWCVLSLQPKVTSSAR